MVKNGIGGWCWKKGECRGSPRIQTLAFLYQKVEYLLPEKSYKGEMQFVLSGLIRYDLISFGKVLCLICLGRLDWIAQRWVGCS